MPKLSVEIPKGLMDAETKKYINKLERKITRLEDKVWNLEQDKEFNEDKVKRAQGILDVVQEVGKFITEEELEEAYDNGRC